MLTTENQESLDLEIRPEAIRGQLELLVSDKVFRSSKRSVQFLRYVVEQTLSGYADQIKERTIGVEVFGKDPSYDTNADHVVRTAANELRKRLAIYYGEEAHRGELRMSLIPGSYIPRFTAPVSHDGPEAEMPLLHGTAASPVPFAPPLETVKPAEVPPLLVTQRDSHKLEFKQHRWLFSALAAVVVSIIVTGASLWPHFTHRENAQDLFWKPVVEAQGTVLLAVGDVPNGPPTSSVETQSQADTLPVIHKTSSSTVPFADAVTTARILGILASRSKKVVIRRESESTFSQLREGPVVLIGAFNNEWSLRLTRQLRYTLALDSDEHLIYIRDTKNPSGRSWSWKTDNSTQNHGNPGSPSLEDYALISRIWNSETGQVLIVVGGLYTYGTEAAGEFLSDPQLMEALLKVAPLDDAHRSLQIVLGTKVTDGTPGPPRVLTVATE